MSGTERFRPAWDKRDVFKEDGKTPTNDEMKKVFKDTQDSMRVKTDDKSLRMAKKWNKTLASVGQNPFFHVVGGDPFNN